MAHPGPAPHPPATERDAGLAAELLVRAVSDDPGVEADARTALVADHPDVRCAAVGALARLGRLELDDIARAIDDPDPAVAIRAVEALAATIGSDGLDEGGADRAADLLLVALADARLADVAAYALGEFGDGGSRLTAAASIEAALVSMSAGHPDHLCRESAVAALGALAMGKAAVLAALGDRATVRRRAVIALASFDGDDVDAALRDALSDRDWQTRQSAEDQL